MWAMMEARRVLYQVKSTATFRVKQSVLSYNRVSSLCILMYISSRNRHKTQQNVSLIRKYAVFTT